MCARRSFMCLGVLAASLQTGCSTFSTHLTPRPTAKGDTELAANMDVLVTTVSKERVVRPNVELGIRHGLSDTVDIGGKANLLGAEINSRISLLRTERLELGIVPGAGFSLSSFTSKDTGLLVASFSLPVLVGLALSDNATVVLGGKMIGHFAAAAIESRHYDATTDRTAATMGEGDFLLYPGGVVGVQFRLSEGFALFPELNVHGAYNVDQKAWRKPVWQGGLAFQFTFGG